MKKLKVLQQLTEAGVVAVLRADSPEEVVEMSRSRAELKRLKLR
jgi:2-dehydro-3-deoxyphosphogluconate aldolase/(4S)-4-hydroxy-2-oxoglutarate aldolase